MGTATISHEQEYGTLECKGCKREWILLNVIRNAANDVSIIEQNDFDYCSFCGRKRGFEE